MASDGAVGKFFKATSTSINTFGHSLSRRGATNWILDSWVEVKADDDCVGDVEGIIKADIAAGQEARIDHVLVSSRVFNVLYMCGVVTYDHMLKATENEEEKSITVTGVKFLNKEYTVKVMDADDMKSQYGFDSAATIDAAGEVV